MKRSEMVSKIKYQMYGSSNYKGHLDEAEAILNLVQNLGMLPPIIGNKTAFETVEDEIKPRWENENET